MRTWITRAAICLGFGALLTVGTAWGLWLGRPGATKHALGAEAITTVLEREYGTLVEPFAPNGMVSSGHGWRDTFATTMTLAGTRQVRVVEAGWPRRCLTAAERPRDNRGFVVLPVAARVTGGDGRVPYLPRWRALGFNVAVLSGAVAGIGFLVPRLVRRVQRRPGQQPI